MQSLLSKLSPKRRGATPSPHLKSLPDDAVRNIFSFVSNTADFYEVQFVCQRFYQLLTADEQWKHCEQSDDDRVESHRERACIASALANIQEYQTTYEGNVFVEVLGVAGWRTVLEKISLLNQVSPSTFNRDIISFRGDTLAVLGAMVQDTLTTWLKKSNRICIHRVGDGSGVYPALTAADYDLMEEITRPYDVHVSFALTPGPMNTVSADDLGFLFGPNYQVSSDRIIRKLSYMAGIVKMEDAIYDKVWESFVVFMRRLLVGAHAHAQVLLQDRNGIPDDVIEAMGTACEHLQGDGGLDQIPEQLLERVEEHMTRVSPYRFEGHAYPTPRQIVVAASKMGLPNAHVYNSDWWTAENLTKDLEMVHAIRQYTMPRRDEGAGQRMDQLPDEDTWASGDFEDESEESFSIYDEEENTDDEAFSG